MINKSEKKTDKTELDIDIIAVIQFLWSKRKLFLKSSGIAVIIGLVIAFSIPKEYTTTVKLMPETNNTASKMGNLGGLAAMAGIDINSGNSQDAISPEVYPDIVHSTPFLLELFPQEVTNKKKTLKIFPPRIPIVTTNRINTKVSAGMSGTVMDSRPSASAAMFATMVSYAADPTTLKRSHGK